MLLFNIGHDCLFVGKHLCFIVFEILLTYHDTGSWGKALSAGVPTGKGYVVSSEAELDLP